MIVVVTELTRGVRFLKRVQTSILIADIYANRAWCGDKDATGGPPPGVELLMNSQCEGQCTYSFYAACCVVALHGFFLFFHHLYFPAQLVGGFTISDLLDKPWSQVSSLLPPGTCLHLHRA